MTSQGSEDESPRESNPTLEYLRILRRRKWLALAVATVIIVVAVTMAIVLPATYQSVATILIEEPGVSDDLAKSTDVGFADQRLQLIQQRVMTTAKLEAVIDKLGLYQEARQTTPMNVLAENMRTQISLKIVGADSAEAKNDRTAKKTTAFTLGFVGRNPETTQKVTRELVDLYMAENERTQRNRATETAGFLGAESTRLAKRIRELETELAAFKTENAGMLPEEMAFNTQLLDRTQNQMLEIMRQAQSVRERQAFLQAQLLSLDPQAPLNATNPETLAPRARLRLLKSQYSTMSAKYGANHPDVINLRRQIEAMNGSVDTALSSDSIDALKAELEAAHQKYGASHPEILRLKREIETAEQTPVASQEPVDVPDNPLYIQTQGQLAALDAEIGTSQSQIAALQEKINEIESRILKTPEVERGYLALKREYDSTVSKYQDIQARESQADLAKNLEVGQMGERLSLIEPPPLPVNPISPNRPAIVLFGIVLGCMAGIGAAMLAESLDGRVYGHRRLAAMAGASPLAVIPRIVTAGDKRRARQRRFSYSASAALIVFLVVAIFSMDSTSVDDTWNALVTRLDNNL